jgi:hypothetical protein
MIVGSVCGWKSAETPLSQSAKLPEGWMPSGSREGKATRRIKRTIGWVFADKCEYHLPVLGAMPRHNVAQYGCDAELEADDEESGDKGRV